MYRGASAPRFAITARQSKNQTRALPETDRTEQPGCDRPLCPCQALRTAGKRSILVRVCDIRHKLRRILKHQYGATNTTHDND